MGSLIVIWVVVSGESGPGYLMVFMVGLEGSLMVIGVLVLGETGP